MGFLGTYLEYKTTMIDEKKNLFQHPLNSGLIKDPNPSSINPGTYKP